MIHTFALVTLAAFPSAKALDAAADKVFAALVPRFGSTDGGRFGMSRMAMPSIHDFIRLESRGKQPTNPGFVYFPESAADKALVQDLKARKITNAFYTFSASKYRRLRGPASMWSGQNASPADADANELANKVAALASKSDQKFERSGWRYYARPVLALDENCVKCHSQMFVGSPENKFDVKVGAVLGYLMLAMKQS